MTYLTEENIWPSSGCGRNSICSVMVGGARPVDDPKLVEESLHLPGGEHLGPVTGQHHRDDEDRHIGVENVEHSNMAVAP